MTTSDPEALGVTKGQCSERLYHNVDGGRYLSVSSSSRTVNDSLNDYHGTATLQTFIAGLKQAAAIG
jgi:hypothetical protein